MQWVSLELDGELSELEEAALCRHLDGCARCSEACAEVRSFTRLLRSEPLVELARPLEVALPGRARARAARRIAVSVALAGATAAAAFGGLVLTSGRAPTASALSFRNVQEQRRFAHIEARRLEPAVFVEPKPTVRSFARRVLV
jgi:anti-sigma factor RsiW